MIVSPHGCSARMCAGPAQWPAAPLVRVIPHQLGLPGRIGRGPKRPRTRPRTVGRATRRRKVSPMTRPRTPPAGFCKANRRATPASPQGCAARPWARPRARHTLPRSTDDGRGQHGGEEGHFCKGHLFKFFAGSSKLEVKTGKAGRVSERDLALNRAGEGRGDPRPAKQSSAEGAPDSDAQDPPPAPVCFINAYVWKAEGKSEFQPHK